MGDVVGHGISAALLMTTVRALLRCRLDQPGSIAEAVCDVNRLLYQDTAPSGSFVTLFLLEVDPAAGQPRMGPGRTRPGVVILRRNG